MPFTTLLHEIPRIGILIIPYFDVMKRKAHLKSFILFSFPLIFLFACKNSTSFELTEQTNDITKCNSKITIDGVAREQAWNTTSWLPIDQTWIGETPSPEDFQGKYKLLWTADHLYVLAEIKDDKLIDTHEDGLDRYWDDDCLEIFIDENQSRDIHQYNHKAFAYHISLDGAVTDIGLDSLPRYFDHVDSRRVTKGSTTLWEAQIELHPDTYKDGVNSPPLKLAAGKEIGFAIAYCDNDSSIERENFMGSIEVQGDDKNRGWIDASIFQKMMLK